MKELSLYIHIPFCRRKCFYCDFLSFSLKKENVSLYLRFLQREMKLYSSSFRDFKVKTVYLGGGTPSLLKEKEVDFLFSSLEKYFHLDSKAEISIEANPESVKRKRVKTWRKVGINRVSLGVQSLNQKTLSLLGRSHTPEEAICAFSLLREEGFTNINIDLIFGLSVSEKWELTLEKTVSLNPEHISTYALILKKGTPLYKKVQNKEVKIDDDESQANKYEFTTCFLKRSGYVHYEISSFSRKGYECVHNLSYWRNENYLGLGVGAHSHIEGLRFANHKSLKKYTKDLEEEKFPYAFKEKLSTEEELKEKIIMSFRLSEGLSKDVLKLFHNYSLPILRRIEVLKERGLIKENKEAFFIPEKYFFVSNFILSQIV